MFNSSSGAGASVTMHGGAPIDARHPGVAALTTGTDSNGRAGSNRSNNTGYLFGAGVAVFTGIVYLSALSDGTDTYAARIGFGNTLTADNVDGVYFEYDSTTSPNWIMKAANNSVRTATVSSTPVVAGAWLNLTIVINATASAAEFFVNGTSIGTIIGTNIPKLPPRISAPSASIIKSAGNTSRTLYVDLLYSDVEFTTPR